MISVMKFLPNVTSELWMSPINGCRLSTMLTAARFQCLDERFTNPSGKPYTRNQRVNVMKELRVAASEHRGESVATADGYSRDDALYAYNKVFPWGKAELYNPTSAQLKQALRDGYFVSLSGNVDDVPQRSTLDNAVNDVPHEIGLARLSNDGSKVLVYEPMRTDRPIWVDWKDILKFGSEFETNGRYVCIRVKTGWSTNEAIAKRDCRNSTTITAKRYNLLVRNIQSILDAA